MTVFCRLFSLILLGFCLFIGSAQAASQAEPPLSLENQRLQQQLRDARREIARLKAAENEPGWEQIVAGVGLIFGCCGVAMMNNARRRR